MNINDIDIKKYLGTHSLIIESNEKEKYVSDKKGIIPLLEYINQPFCSDVVAYDQVVGKASALLFVYLEIKKVNAVIISWKAIEVFDKYHIDYHYQEKVEYIENREKNDVCPLEKEVEQIDDPLLAYLVLKEKVQELRRGVDHSFFEMNYLYNDKSLKWSVEDNTLPMWVAEMDFKVSKQIIDALHRRVDEGIFGYQVIPNMWQEAIISWWRRRHQLEIENDSLLFTTGVIPALTSMVKRLTNVADNVVLLTPVYDIFYHSVENTGRHVLESKMKYQSGRYEIDFCDLERKLSNPLSSLMIFCNPHNPIGKIWSKEELEKVASLCEEYHVMLVSDEVHCDLCTEEKQYIPFATVYDKVISCFSPSKAFNLAGLQSAALMIKDKNIRDVIERGINSDEVAEGNAFAAISTIAAYNDSEKWLDDVCTCIDANRRIVKSFTKQRLKDITLVDSEATYLLWFDISGITADAADFTAFARKYNGLYLADGNKYRGNGECFIRMNIACPHSRLADGLIRLEKAIIQYQKNKM